MCAVVRVCAGLCVRVCVRACVRACACVRNCARARVDVFASVRVIFDMCERAKMGVYLEGSSETQSSGTQDLHYCVRSLYPSMQRRGSLPGCWRAERGPARLFPETVRSVPSNGRTTRQRMSLRAAAHLGSAFTHRCRTALLPISIGWGGRKAGAEENSGGREAWHEGR